MKALIEVLRAQFPHEQARHDAHRVKKVTEADWDARVQSLAGRLHQLVIDEIEKTVKAGDEYCLHMATAALIDANGRLERDIKTAMPALTIAQAMGYEAAAQMLEDAE